MKKGAHQTLSYLSQEDYARFQELILARTGMLFGVRRQGALARSVLSMITSGGYGGLGAYYHRLMNSNTDSDIWDDLIRELTIGETYFFRDSVQFKALRENIFPELILQHRQDRSLRVWSAGCSTGEEPYSIAMLLSDLLPDAQSWNIFILGTDINKGALQKARKGLFRDWSFRQVNPIIRNKYFSLKDQEYRLDPRIKSRVSFAYLNLHDKVYPSLNTNTHAMDLILCRNVAIYQSESVIKEVAGRFYSSLVSGGWLMVGAAETGIPVYGAFVPRNFSGATVFHKVSKPATISPQHGDNIDIHFPGVKPPPPSDLSDFVPAPLVENHQGDTAKKDEDDTAVSGEQEMPEHLYQKGMALLAQKRFEEAMTEFEACIALDVTFIPALFQMGRVSANMGQFEKARSWCMQVIEKEPLHVAAHYTLALIFQAEGDADAAIDRLKKVIFLKPDFVLGHFGLAILYEKKGRKEKFNRHKQQSLNLASKMPSDKVLDGSEDLTAGQLLTMLKIMTGPSNSGKKTR